jgi:hypothetical protein
VRSLEPPFRQHTDSRYDRDIALAGLGIEETQEPEEDSDFIIEKSEYSRFLFCFKLIRHFASA